MIEQTFLCAVGWIDYSWLTLTVSSGVATLWLVGCGLAEAACRASRRHSLTPTLTRLDIVLSNMADNHHGR